MRSRVMRRLGAVHWARMSTCRHPETAVRHGLWLGGVLVVLAGLFGMHGLASHGVAGIGSMTHAAMIDSPVAAIAPTAAALQSVADHAVAMHTLAGSTAMSMSDSTGRDAIDLGMAAMCVAVLGCALIALLSLRASNRIRTVRARPPCPQWFLVDRDPDPPSLIALSIQRC